MKFLLQYEWYNAPSWHQGSLNLSDFGEGPLLAEAFADGLRAHERFRNVHLFKRSEELQEVHG